MKYGVLYCCYGTPELIAPSLLPWAKLKEKFYGIKIAAVHGQFKEYHEMGIPDNDVETIGELAGNAFKGILDYLYIQNTTFNFASDFKVNIDIDKEKGKYQEEAQIRNKGLQYLLDQGCDYIWLLDSDEFYTENQITRIMNFIDDESNNPYAWFRIYFKNYFGSKREWLDGFCPPRIFRVNFAGMKLKQFYWDNDVLYTMNLMDIVSNSLSYANIPKEMAHVRHLTWNTCDRNIRKIDYQLKHFGGQCSYKYEDGEIKIDNDFYLKNNQPLPIIFKDE